jgi:hypothetical protein
MGPNYSDNCIASAIDGKTCSTNITNMATHHISALQTFTTALISSMTNYSFLLAFLFFILFSIFLFYKNLLHPKLAYLFLRLKDSAFNFFFEQQKIISWLSLFEFSPALSISAH